MSARSSLLSRIRCACSLLLGLGGAAAGLLAAQQPDETMVGELAHLLAAADARGFDQSLFAAALRSPTVAIRRQAALAAGRAGDPAAVDLLLAALSDTDEVVRTNAAFALGLLGNARALPSLLAYVRAAPAAEQGASQVEAVAAIARIGGPDAAAAIREILGNGSVPGAATSPAASSALVEAWRLAERAPIRSIIGYVDDPDAGVRWRALFTLGRLRSPDGAAAVAAGLQDGDPAVRAVAARGITRALLDTSRLDRRVVADRLRPLLGDTTWGVRVNALRALAALRDSTVAPVVVPLMGDPNVNVGVQAETTLGVLGGKTAVAALVGRLESAVFAQRRQALIGLAEADSAKGVAAAAGVAGDGDWRWRSVAAEAFGAARDRAHLVALLADPDGRVVAQALQALGQVTAAGDTALLAHARTLLEHADPAVRSVAADLLARRPAVGDIDALVRAYNRAGGDPFDDARLSAVAALGAIAATSADGRVNVATRFVATVPRPEAFLVRRLAASRLPDAAAQWGPAVPLNTGRTDADYRDVVRRYLVPALTRQGRPRITLDTDRGSLTLELFADAAPLTVAAFLALVDRHYFDGHRWHRVVPNFVVQDGDPRGDGWGGPGFVLRDELNPERYGAGSVGMALSGPDTGGSQFFITYSAEPRLDGTYTVFGRVVTGTSVLEEIAQGDRIRSAHR
jgi:cyclophilin family peptidyl-prolyl cis-trans isomerase/HEAT repeat protein